MRIAGTFGIGTVCTSWARNTGNTGSRETSGSRYAAGFATTWRAWRARTIAAASLVSPSITANAAAGLPVAEITGRVTTCHGTSLTMSVMNHGPEIAVAALPALNRLATIGA